MLRHTKREHFETEHFALRLAPDSDVQAEFQLGMVATFDLSGDVETVLGHIATIRDQLTEILNAAGDRR